MADKVNPKEAIAAVTDVIRAKSNELLQKRLKAESRSFGALGVEMPAGNEGLKEEIAELEKLRQILKFKMDLQSGRKRPRSN